MKTLVVIANYGQSQAHYLLKILSTYAAMEQFSVTSIIHTDQQPYNPVYWPLAEIRYVDCSAKLIPMSCRSTIWNYRSEYDLFIYSENDHLITEANLLAWVKCNEAVAVYDIVPGFIQYEVGVDGNLWYPALHGKYRFEDPRKIDQYTMAYCTNLHQASFVFTRDQINRIGAAIDFKKDHKSNYGTKPRAATDLYEYGSYRRMIPIDSNFDSFLIHHMPNRYVNEGLGLSDFKLREILSDLAKRV
jgi:hypothetical protein